MKTVTPIGKLSCAPALLGCCLLISSAFGHIKNEASQFPDIEFSDARFDIVVLVGAGVIPETPVFEPDKPLSKWELATWLALASGLGSGGETPDPEALAAAVLDAGLVDTLEGAASYADLNNLFFAGAASVADPAATPTKAEAASFVAAQLKTDAGLALLEKRDLGPGVTGEVTAVDAGEGHAGAHTYMITIDGTPLPMDTHGRVANGPTDLIQWQGRNVRRSFVIGKGDAAMWKFLEAAPLVQAAANAVNESAAPDVNAPPPINRNVLYGLIAAVVVLGVVLFFRRRRTG
jgi:hypothetical protein